MFIFLDHIVLYGIVLCPVECDILNFTVLCTIGKVIELALPCVQPINEGHWWVWQR